MGVVKIDNFPIFVVDAIPGEIVRLGITKVQKNFAFGRVIKRLQESPNRVQNANQIAITTGIAPLANLKYDAQLEFKQRQVEQLFKKSILTLMSAQPLGWLIRPSIVTRPKCLCKKSMAAWKLVFIVVGHTT